MTSKAATWTIPAGFCECGCGERTLPATKTDRSRGHTKGVPLRFVHTHQGRVSRPLPSHTCEVEGCMRPVMSAVACTKHHRRMLKFGSYELPPKPSTEERFWSKVDKEGPTPAHAPELGRCWSWTGAPNTERPTFAVSHTRFELAYRYSLALVEPLVSELEVDHLCRNPRCVRPSHLEQVTPTENKRRALPFRRALTHCPAGHDYAETGVINSVGHRECRTCIRTRQRKGAKR